MCSIIGSRPQSEFIQKIYKVTSSVKLSCTELFVVKYPAGIESRLKHSSQNRTGLGGWTMKTENRDENRFFKHKEPGICGNSMNP